MANFDTYFESLQKAIIAYAQDNWEEYEDLIKKDTDKFLDQIKLDLERWLKMLAKGDLTKGDFEWLVIGKRDLIELNKLKIKGLSQISLDRLVNGIVDIIISTAFKVFL